MSFAVDVLSNIVANIVFWALLGGLFYLFAELARRRFVTFFGLKRGGRAIVVLSNLWTPKSSGRSIGFSVAQHELMAAQSVCGYV